MPHHYVFCRRPQNEWTLRVFPVSPLRSSVGCIDYPNLRGTRHIRRTLRPKRDMQPPTPIQLFQAGSEAAARQIKNRFTPKAARTSIPG